MCSIVSTQIRSSKEFLDYGLSNFDSLIFKGICSSKILHKLNSCFKIGEGKSIHFGGILVFRGHMIQISSHVMFLSQLI